MFELMSRNYKFYNPTGLYFVSFATVNWIDVFTRNLYRDIYVDSLNHCIKEKGLIVYAWVVMTNHIHMIIRSKDLPLEGIMRDLKSYTSRSIVQSIKDNPQESRKEWILWMFERAGKKNANNKNAQFWQQHNQPIELGREAYDIDNCLDYIHNNPVEAGFVFRPEDYQYSSAIDYAGGKGMVKIELL